MNTENNQIHGAYIENVNTNHTIGRIVEEYANRKWWKGFWGGWTSAMIFMSLVLTIHKKSI
jgi:hypothetical protein